ncbi:YggT family protein [Aeromicrobium sp. IC_218]|uniref:YggT family protein n=1 Tax=Aeromicrobium sp. IC_218 TaxID=2545468 RepID=UPI00103BDD56|nr:YggT family protein [Aeromicrobium sp. IC_218]TCI99763.1 YggT family protein [Aeromicrobium sp. IC_218]
MEIVGSFIALVLWLALVLLIARFVLDWVQLLARSWRPSGFVAVLCEAIYTVTDPPLRLVRGVVPPIRLGGASLDLSPMILIIVIYLLQIINRIIFF